MVKLKSVQSLNKYTVVIFFFFWGGGGRSQRGKVKAVGFDSSPTQRQPVRMHSSPTL